MGTRSTTSYFLVVFCSVFLCVSTLGAYASPQHAWLGLRSPEFWQDYDPEFYAQLTSQPDPGTPEDSVHMMLMKFYLIGCIVPDLFEPFGMKMSRNAVQGLHQFPSILVQDPLRIQDSTNARVAMVDSFEWSCQRPNQNPPALWQMVQFARANNWSAANKAMVYGAYAHVVMDLAAGYYQQPTAWGWEQLAEPPQAESLGDILANAEFQAELFEPTFIAQVGGISWTAVDNVLFSGYNDYTHLFEPATACFFRSYGFNRTGYIGWQGYSFEQLDSFVSLTNRCFQVTNLTPERLSAYVHGFAIYNFALCGYCQLNSNDAGGLFAHPQWTGQQILDYLLNIGDPGAIPGWNVGNLSADGQWVVKFLLFGGLWGVEEIAEHFALVLWLPGVDLSGAWTDYFQSASNFQEFADAVKAVFIARGDTAPGWFDTLTIRTAAYLENWSSSFEPAGNTGPWQRSYYAGEPGVALNLVPEMKRNIDGGPAYLSHQINYPFQSGVQARTLARKAGLTGGMYQAYGHDRQPGIVNMCFLRDDRLVFAQESIQQHGDPVLGELFYDVLPFSSSLTFRVEGCTSSGWVTLASETRALTPYQRCTGSLEFDMSAALSQGVSRVSFSVRTPGGSGDLEMLNSDYSAAYMSSADFYEDTLYAHWFNNGDPVRDTLENPLLDPTHYWPYVLPIVPQDAWFIARPTGLTASAVPEGIHLVWQNRSQCADRVVILRSVDSGGFARYDSVGPDSTAYLDADVDCGHSYDYHIVAYHDTFASEHADAGSVTFDQPWLRCSDVPHGSKYKHIRDGGSLAGLEGPTDAYVYALKGSNTCEFYRYGVAANHFWTAKESIPATGSTGTARRPFKGAALTSGSDGKLYAVKGNFTREFWRYDPSLSGSDTYPWCELANIPAGPYNKRVRQGAGLAAVTVNDTCCIYLLKGSNTYEFFRYNTQSGAWAAMASAPVGPAHRRFKDGSCLAYDPDNGSIYALKGYSNEFYSYSVAQNTWVSRETMPRKGQSGKKKVARYGTSLAYGSGRVYALKGYSTNDLSFYRPDQGAWAIACSLPLYPTTKGVGRGGALTVIAGHLWALRGNSTLDFWRYSPGQEQDLAVGPDEPGPGQNEVLVASAAGAANPRWSPNGEFIAYTAPDANGRNQVFAAYVNDTLAPLQITNTLGQCACPSFAPDANHIVFEYQPDTAAYTKIGVTALQGGSIVTVGRNTADCRNPEWSCNGQMVYFESDDGNGYSQLWSAPALGGTPTQLTNSAMNHESPRALSSTELVFQGEDGNGFGQIYRLVINTGTEVQLTSSSADHESPSVARSPRIVAYVVANPAGYQQIAKVSANGGPETWLTSGQADHTAPSITGDGLTVECTQSNVGSNSICEVDVLTASTTQRTDNCAGRESPDSRVTNSAQRWVSAAYARSDGIYRTVNGGGGGGMGNTGAIVSFDGFGPNPSTGRSTVFWSLRAPARVQIRLFDVTGRSVRTFVDGTALAGTYRTQLDTRRLAHGVYVLKMKAGEYRKTYKLILE